MLLSSVSIKGFCLLFPSNACVFCFHQILLFFVSIKCFSHLFPSNASLICFHQMLVCPLFPSNASLICFHQMLLSSVSIKCFSHLFPSNACVSSVSIKCFSHLFPSNASLICFHQMLVCPLFPSNASLICFNQMLLSSVSIKCFSHLIHQILLSSASMKCFSPLFPSTVSVCLQSPDDAADPEANDDQVGHDPRGGSAYGHAHARHCGNGHHHSQLLQLRKNRYRYIDFGVCPSRQAVQQVFTVCTCSRKKFNIRCQSVNLQQYYRNRYGITVVSSLQFFSAL